MEQQDTSITPIEASILSEITPEDAEKLVSFLTAMPAPKTINPCMTWEESHHLDRLFDTVRAFLVFRSHDEGGAA